MAAPLTFRRVRTIARDAWSAVADVLSGRIIRRWQYGRYSVPVSAIKIETITNALTTAASVGDLTFIADIHDLMPATDPHLYGVRRQLRAGVAGIKMTVVPVDDSEEAATAADLVRKAEERAGVNNRTLTDGIIEGGLRGASLTEVLWEPPEVGKVRYWTGFSPVPEQRLRYDLTSGDLRLVESPYSISKGVPLSEFPAGKFIRAQVDTDVPDFSMRGAYRSIISEWFGRLNVGKWEQIAIERFGMPIPVGKASGEKARETMTEAMKAFGAAGMMIIDPDSDVVFGATQIVTSGNLVHETYFEKSAERISLALLGATQTATIAKDAGSKQSADTHQGIRRDILYSILDLIAEAKRRDLWEPFVRMNLGERFVPFTPRCVPEFDEPIDLLTTVQAWDILRNRLGLPMAKAYLYETTGVEEPDADQELVSGAPEAAPAASPTAPGLAPVLDFPAPQAAPEAAPADVQALALNGAQVAALQAIVAAVADGTIPPESAIAIVRVSFPAIGEQMARAIIEPVRPRPQLPPATPPPPAPAAAPVTASVTVPDLDEAGDGEPEAPVPEDFGKDITDELRRIVSRPKSTGALKELGPRLRAAKPDVTRTADALAAEMLEATMRTLMKAKKPPTEGTP